MARTAMNTPKQYESVAAVLMANKGRPVSIEEIERQLGPTNPAIYRLPTYIWEIKNKMGATVEAIKEGRLVVAYRMLPTGRQAAASTPARRASGTGGTARQQAYREKVKRIAAQAKAKGPAPRSAMTAQPAKRGPGRPRKN